MFGQELPVTFSYVLSERNSPSGKKAISRAKYGNAGMRQT
jgi:hypothetical protein